MATTRSKSLVAIVILLVVLAVLSATSLAVTQLGLAAGGFRGARGAGCPASGTPVPGGSTQGNSASAGGTGGNFQGGNFPGRGGGGGFFSFFSLAGIFRALGIDFQYMGIANISVPAVGILLLLVSALGVWMQKRWALYLAIVVGILFLLSAVPGLFFGAGRFTLVRTGLNVLNAACAIAVLVLGFLPSSRKSVS